MGDYGHDLEFGVFITPARDASVLTLIIITVGVSIVLRGLALLIWGVNPRSYDPFTAGPAVDVLGLAFSRQSLSEPKLLLLDEPLAGLTDAETAEIGRVLRELAADGLGVLLVDHATDAVMALSDHVVVLDRGAVLAEGPPDRIRGDARVVAAYLGEAA